MFKKIALAAALTVAFTAQAATTIETFSAWNGNNFVWEWGNPDTATYGQTFTTGATDTVLKSFTFAMTDLDQDFKAYVGAWDGSKASSILWTSPVLNFSYGYDGFEKIAVSTPSLQLSANTQYVAFFSTSGLQTASRGTNKWGLVNSNEYAGGEFVYFNNENDPSKLTSANWDGLNWGGDLAFRMELTTPVPEPETYAMLLAGLGLMGAVARRRRKQA
ncbi:PEP-CTERM sorting domain-containing protein [Rhodoferax bucti]|uniref:PEP-CTERM sorting domain-containing protein n=1 Tax=Rhodoferax bucti TaxID=2576305 RepID=UPI001108E6E4|nr:PEP-CTERM sorting domain-containing protein [Rhodoferax bucti]